jgi:hypothetical protein
MVSQAVWTKDLVNVGDVSNSLRPRDIFPATAISLIHLEYEDSLTAADIYADITSPARIVASASNYGLQTDTVTYPTTDLFTNIFTRPQAPTSWSDYALNTNINQQRLFLVFFCNPNFVGTISQANLLGYECSLYTETVLQTGGVLDSAFCYANPADATPTVNCTRAVVGGKTQVTVGFTFPNINVTKTTGAIDVRVNGAVIPKLVTGSTTGAYWKPVIGTSNVIEFWTDLTGMNSAIEVVLREGIVDLSVSNASRFTALYDAVVGSAAQVASNIATHTSINQAIIDSVAGSFIKVLKGSFDAGGVSVTKNVTIDGQGYGTVISGAFTLITVWF